MLVTKQTWKEIVMTYQQLTLEERSILYGLRKAGFSINEVAKEIDRDKSTISRELKRNTGKKGYRPKQANEKAQMRKKNSHKMIKFTRSVKKQVEHKLKQEWSPVQISGWLKKIKDISISHESIYQFLKSDKNTGGIHYTHLRQGNKKRRKKYGKNTSKRGQIRDRISISERPAYIEKRTTCGHWEGDTIIGKNHKGAMITLVERKFGWTENFSFQKLK
jgi:IS30 family transposase